MDLFAQLSRLELCQWPEAHLRVTRGRAHLDPLETHAGQFLQRAVEILADCLPDRPCLAPDRKAQGVGAQSPRPERANRADRTHLEEASPRNCIRIVHGEHRILPLPLPQACESARRISSWPTTVGPFHPGSILCQDCLTISPPRNTRLPSGGALPCGRP